MYQVEAGHDQLHLEQSSLAIELVAAGLAPHYEGRTTPGRKKWDLIDYSDIVSDMAPGSICIHWKYILAFFLAFITTYFLAYIYAYMLTILTFFLPSILGFYLADYSGILFWHSIWHLWWHSFWCIWLMSGSGHWDLELAVEVRQCQLRSGARVWDLELVVGVWRSGSGHWDLELAVEDWDLALASEIWSSWLGSGSGHWYLSSRLRSGSGHWDLELTVGVRQWPLRSGARSWGPQCPLKSGARSWARQWPLRSGARGWGPAMATEIWSSRLNAVEVRQWPLRSGARSWGPAMATDIWSSRLRSGSGHWDLEGRKEGSNSDKTCWYEKNYGIYLAGGEIWYTTKKLNVNHT